MSIKIPHHALIVVAEGAGARFFNKISPNADVKLVAAGELSPARLHSDGPSGKRPPKQSQQETDEATFAKQLAHGLYARAHRDAFKALVLIDDPQTLGQIRPLLHKDVVSRVIAEHAKSLTRATIADIEKTLN